MLTCVAKTVLCWIFIGPSCDDYRPVSITNKLVSDCVKKKKRLRTVITKSHVIDIMDSEFRSLIVNHRKLNLRGSFFSILTLHGLLQTQNFGILSYHLRFCLYINYRSRRDGSSSWWHEAFLQTSNSHLLMATFKWNWTIRNRILAVFVVLCINLCASILVFRSIFIHWRRLILLHDVLLSGAEMVEVGYVTAI